MCLCGQDNGLSVGIFLQGGLWRMLWKLHRWILWTWEGCEPGLIELGGGCVQRNHWTTGETGESSHVFYTGLLKIYIYIFVLIV